MHKKSFKRLFVALASAFILLAPALGAEDSYRVRRPLFRIETEHFTFIFPKESRIAAERLAGMAEGIYDEVAGLLAAPKSLKIPVTFTPDAEELNGSFTPIPSPRIKLFEAPIPPNSGFALFDDALKKLFMHELTHAVSMTMMSPVSKFVSGIFVQGGISTVSLLAPPTFIEGVTVSFESRNGFGRANDTPYASNIQQDIIEDRFRNLDEADGALEGYPGGTWYVYGGWFSRYLQETYGMEKYASLWKQLGDFRSFQSFGPFKGAFETAFGVKFPIAWEDFRRWMSPKGPILTELHPILTDYDYYPAIASGRGRLFAAATDGVYEIDPKGGKKRLLFAADPMINRLSVDAAGETLLVSRAVYDEGLATLELKAFDLKSKRFLPRKFPALLREASFVPAGIAATRNSGYSLDLVLLKDDGTTELLLKGTERLIPSNPCAWGEESLIFILQRDGKNEVATIDIATKEVSILRTDVPLDGKRRLSAEGGKAYFVWDDDRSFFKLGILDRESGNVSYQRIGASGGMESPVALGDTLSYVADLSRGQRLMLLPRSPLEWADGATDSTWMVLGADEIARSSAYDAAPAMDAKPYNVLPWLLPQIRYPIFSFGTSIEDFVNGAGLGFLSQDPSDAVALQGELVYLWNEAFLDAKGGITLSVLPFDLSIAIEDGLIQPNSPGAQATRRLGGSLGVSDYFYLGTAYRLLTYSIGSGAYWESSGPSGSQAYAWALGGARIPLRGKIAYSDYTRQGWDQNSEKGYGLSLSYEGNMAPSALALPSGYGAVNAGFTVPFFNLGLDAWAAMAMGANSSVGPAGGDYLPAFKAYADLNASLAGPYYAYAEANVGHVFVVQRNFLPGIYVDSIDAKAGYRAALSSGGALGLNAAVFGIVAADMRIGGLGTFSGLPLSLGIETWYAFDRGDGRALVVKPYAGGALAF